MVRQRNLAPGEVVVAETHISRWVAFTGPVAVIALLGVVTYGAAAAVWPALVAIPWLTPALASLAGYGSAHLYVFYALSALTGVAVVWLGVRYVVWWSRVYAVTDHRVLLQHGFFYRAVDEIPVDQIRGVDAFQSLGQRILGYGTVRVSSEGGRSSLGNEDWRGIPKPLDLQRTVEAMVQAHSLPHLLPPSAPPAPTVTAVAGTQPAGH